MIASRLLSTHSLPAVAILFFVSQNVFAANIHVGPDQTYASLNEALPHAKPGDRIIVHPQAQNAPYEQAALQLHIANLTIEAAPDAHSPIPLSGKSFDYSGEGRIPRAIVQFDPQSSGSSLIGFELFGAHNQSHNGSGVRINQANNILLRNCIIHGNDMGVMSGGNGTDNTAVNQRIESCHVYENGDLADPGYNHNFYLGGTSVTLLACEVNSAITGHNVKSRAHFTRVEYCLIHDSANREFDLVDARGDTTVEHSDAVLIGNIIVKDPHCKGNRAVIHFGQDGGHDRNGTLYLVNNTIVTPFKSPVVELSAPNAHAAIFNNLVWDANVGQSGQVLLAARGEAKLENATGSHNWLARNFAAPAGVECVVESGPERVTFLAPERFNFHWSESPGSLDGPGVAIASLKLPEVPGDGLGPALPFAQYARGYKYDPRHDARAPAMGGVEKTTRSHED